MDPAAAPGQGMMPASFVLAGQVAPASPFVRSVPAVHGQAGDSIPAEHGQAGGSVPSGAGDYAIRDAALDEIFMRGFEDNCRKPELSELKQVREFVRCDLFVMRNTSVDIKVIVEGIEKKLGEAVTAVVREELDELMDLTYALDKQVQETEPAKYILRERDVGEPTVNYLSSASSSD